jgi:2-polyprenyl-6-methoxyphenol hydroxylase-like FAD-dependent oxidoreductase
MGQGACTALEDAYVLARCLQIQPEPRLAFQHYEALRLPRTSAITAESLRSAKLGELSHPITVGLRNTFMKAMGAAISHRFRSMQSYRA